MINYQPQLVNRISSINSIFSGFQTFVSGSRVSSGRIWAPPWVTINTPGVGSTETGATYLHRGPKSFRGWTGIMQSGPWGGWFDVAGWELVQFPVIFGFLLAKNQCFPISLGGIWEKFVFETEFWLCGYFLWNEYRSSLNKNGGNTTMKNSPLGPWLKIKWCQYDSWWFQTTCKHFLTIKWTMNHNHSLISVTVNEIMKYLCFGCIIYELTHGVVPVNRQSS